LEKLVIERTVELQRTNELLKAEYEKSKIAEHAVKKALEDEIEIGKMMKKYKH
jgi:C4-dicarboxylate-specific signal transduction histidine kinase